MQYTYTDVINGVTETHVVTMDDPEPDATRIARIAPLWLAQMADPLNTAVLQAADDAAIARMYSTVNVAKIATAVDANHATPRYVQPGGFAADDAGAILALDAGGKVFRNGVRLGMAVAAQALIYGSGLFMHGATDGKWWEWTNNAWSVLTGVHELDPSIFTT